jgi:hypothetical protein
LSWAFADRSGLEQWLAFMQALLKRASHSLSGLLCDLELNRSACLPLYHCSAGSHSPIEGRIVDPQRDQVTGAQLAVEEQVE